MPRDLIEDIKKEINQEELAPIWLYRIELPSPVDDLYLAEAEDSVDYFETNSGVHSSRTYVAYPITHQGISENTQTQIDALQVIVQNVDKAIQYYLETYDGMRGFKVTVRQVFRGFLTDNTAYIEDIFYIDSVQIDEQSAQFTLTTKLDILTVQFPRRRIQRSTCQFRYKGLGCWLDDGVGGFSSPTDFKTDEILLKEGPVENTYGLEIPLVGGYYSSTAAKIAFAYANFTPIAIPDLEKTSVWSLRIILYCSNPSQMDGTVGYLKISSSTTNEVQEWFINATDLLSEIGGDIGDLATWFQIDLPLNLFSDYGGGLNVSSIRSIRWYHQTSAASHIIGFAAVKILQRTDLSVAQASFKPINLTGLTKANGTFTVDLMTDNINISASSQIELSSDDYPDVAEWCKTDLSGVGITGSWQTFNFPMSGWTTEGSELDVTAIKRIRIYALSSDSNAINLQWRNALITHALFLDGCNKTIEDCIRHNNLLRFGAFPGVPSRRIFRG